MSLHADIENKLVHKMLPHFLYGTAWKEESTQKLTLLALKFGFTGIDTANQRKHYNEIELIESISTLS
jgi:hypothetical protein